MHNSDNTVTMRPTRLLLTLATSLLLITLLLFIVPARTSSAPPPLTATKKRSRLRALFSFRTPLSIFPPSAIISLYGDNGTFFLARAAAFGPQLPSHGLSGQLWIGSGFGEDGLGSGGRAEGELGCSDVPGWDESMGKPGNKDSGSMKYAVHKGKDDKKSKKNSRRSSGPGADIDDAEEIVVQQPSDDGTDDHLYHAPQEQELAKNAADKSLKEHADIQSLQESAEIWGKVVLLSRGGCGFVEKAKWVQRRGGKALIVGDDQKGGPLVTMYARGDTSNITVPALFTSYTTAHLLSSLIPSGGVLGALPTDGNQAGPKKGSDLGQIENDQLTFTTVVENSQPTSKSPKLDGELEQDELKTKRSWVGRLFRWVVGKSDDDDISRWPPGSGNLGWVLVEDFEEKKPKKITKEQALEEQGAATDTDKFVIGVHDWRDPDMVPSPMAGNAEDSHRQKDTTKSGKQLKGDIVTPGSGIYERPKPGKQSKNKHKGDKHTSEKESKGSDGWLSKLTGSHNADGNGKSYEAIQCAGEKCNVQPVSKAPQAPQSAAAPPKHEGLWVTLTPTTMSSSPFLDTLLVLVVSPLVTLTIVYALLLLRSRIRRRRWRAPKSVVDRLPVRTYHTIASEASSTSVATPSASSPTTPLLQPAPRRIPSRSSSRSRPRSRTTSEVPVQGTSSSLLGEHSASPATIEKREAGLAEWRRKYGGRQRECVVCLEEYVDGVSRVMSLPCGHEFHVDCM